MMETESNPWDALVEPATRTPRSLETREHTERKRSWREPTILPDPVPQDGYVFKWCRTGSRGQDDKVTFEKRMYEGWEPINAADHPELVSAMGLKQSSGHVERGGLILCKMTAEMAKQRHDHYQGIAKDQETSAEQHYMRDNHELVKKFQENTRKVVFGQNVR